MFSASLSDNRHEPNTDSKSLKSNRLSPHSPEESTSNIPTFMQLSGFCRNLYFYTYVCVCVYYLCCHPSRINCHEAYLLHAEHTTTCDAHCHIRSPMAILPRAHQLHAHCLAQRPGCWKQSRGCSTNTMPTRQLILRPREV